MENCTECERQPTKPTGVCPVFNMSDGRHFTNYNSRCMQNDSLSKTGKVMNSYEYRIYLQKNAEKLMSQNQELALNSNMCTPCFDYDQDGTMLPEANKFQCNENTCTLSQNNVDGIGTGRNYAVAPNGVIGKSELVNGTGDNGTLAEPYLNFRR
jgi:hypothetical protein